MDSLIHVLALLEQPAAQLALYGLSLTANITAFLASPRARAWYRRTAEAVVATPPVRPPVRSLTTRRRRHSLAHR